MSIRFKRFTLMAIATVLATQLGVAADQKPNPLACNRVRLFPAPGREQAMVGGKITGSNTSAREGFEVLAEITSAPAPGQWTELAVPNTKLYRWIRYEAPPGSHGIVAEIEFYAGKRMMIGRTFGSFGWRGLHNWPRAFDKKTDTWFESDCPDGQYVGIDVGEWATAQTPRMDPPPGDKEPNAPLQVSLHCNTPGAVIRYSFDGTPGPNDGAVYEKPIRVDRLTTLFAVAFKEGFPPSPVGWGTYPAGTPLKPGFHSFHVGNSLTASTMRFADFARAAGFSHDYHASLKNGGSTPGIWNNIQSKARADWDKELAAIPSLEHFSVQPRLPDFTDAALENEARHDVLFFDAARAKSPQVQPWIYAEWPSRRPGFNGWPTPPTTYEEACAALMAAIETIERKVCETYKGDKKPRILPCTLGVARLRNLLDQGKIPGWSSKDFDEIMFYDNVHPGEPSRYLLCMIWFASFYGQSPVGKIPPVNTNITAEQAGALQRLAWDVVKNYPDCGLYEEGTSPCGKPEFHVAPASLPALSGLRGPSDAGKDAGATARQITLSSSTPGAWFRYTLDGTTPSRMHGYVYCGVISVQPGIRVKAVAYKSGMADSEVAEDVLGSK